MLVDDEPLVLSGLEEIIEWEKEGFEIAGRYRDAHTALNFLEKEKVDVVFTDIRMPVVNGIDFIAAIKRKSPEIKCVIISAFKDFDIARKAIAYKAEAYILKPLQKDDILNILQKIKNDLDTNEANEYLIDLEDGESAARAIAVLRKTAQSRCCCIVVSDDPPEKTRDLNFVFLNIKGALAKVWFCSAGERVFFPEGIISSRWHITCDDLVLMIWEAVLAANGHFTFSKHALVSRIQLYIGIHYRENMSLGKIAEKFNISESYLCELFKKESGETIIGFYTRIRLHNARRLLCCGDMSIKEVAYVSGFNDYSYFSRSFKKYFGFAPEISQKDGNRPDPLYYPFPVINRETLALKNGQNMGFVKESAFFDGSGV
jgi:two-component system response regulator YesN